MSALAVHTTSRLILTAEAPLPEADVARISLQRDVQLATSIDSRLLHL